MLFSLASAASALVPARQAEALRRARDRVLRDSAANVTLGFWRAARPAADASNTDDKWEAARRHAAVSA